MTKHEARSHGYARWYVRRSAPIGRRDLKPKRKIRFGNRKMPKSWPAKLWFSSALFNRGKASRRRAFAKLAPLAAVRDYLKEQG